MHFNNFSQVFIYWERSRSNFLQLAQRYIIGGASVRDQSTSVFPTIFFFFFFEPAALLILSRRSFPIFQNHLHLSLICQFLFTITWELVYAQLFSITRNDINSSFLRQVQRTTLELSSFFVSWSRVKTISFVCFCLWLQWKKW